MIGFYVNASGGLQGQSVTAMPMNIRDDTCFAFLFHSQLSCTQILEISSSVLR